MAIKFQYNKTSLNDLDKQLKIRTRALPTIKSKESALRVEVKKAKDSVEQYNERIDELVAQYDYMVALWGEFDRELIGVKDVVPTLSKIAGVKIASLKEIIFEQKEYDMFSYPVWTADGIALLKELAKEGIEREFLLHKTALLDRARKKTTQKVNLYEKVQIPGYEDAIRKIKRFLEDEENLSKSSQKIVKTRHSQQEEEGAL
ncbi:MAG: V-type ATP synthase subunit D [Rikenellaceae bacterium]